MSEHETIGTRVVRWVLGPAVLGYFLHLSLVAAVFAGWGNSGRTAAGRLREAADSLAVSLLWGAVAVAGFRLLVGFRLLSWWLACALIIPAYAALEAVDAL